MTLDPAARPYFVMELVKGMPVTQFCDEHHLTPRERLELFLPVCQAVQHAHQKGVIHRDLKPSNILVAEYDDRAVPKIIDFGVAKAVSQRLTEKTMFTQYGQIVGTLEYMSPEQAKLNQLDVDTRSDIYALGVLLYELLTGETPFDKQRLRAAAFDELLRIIREEEPPRPSTRLSSSETLPSIAANRRMEPKKLSLLVRGELDWIVMKALEKDRARRYETANAFAMDVQRYLSDEPVQACPPSAGYRFRKFARRNRIVIATASAVALSLVGGAGLASWQAVQATRARDNAMVAEQHATQAAAVATAINSFIKDDLLSQADPANEPDREITLRKVVDRASASVGDRFPDEPLVEAGIRETLGHTYLGLGEYEQALQHFRRAADINLEIRGPDHNDTLADQNNVAAALEQLGHYAEAEVEYARILNATRRTLGTDHANTLICLNNLAWSIRMQGDFERALPLFREALDARRRTLGEEHEDTLDSMHDLGALYLEMNRLDEAEPLLRKVVEVRRRTPGDENPRTLTSMNSLAMLLQRREDYDAAESLFRTTLKIRRNVLTESHPDTISSINNLAVLYSDMGRRDDAERLYREALDLARRFLGDGHPSTMHYRDNLAKFYINSGRERLPDAVPLLEEALTIAVDEYGTGHREANHARLELASIYQAVGRPADAERLLREQLDLIETHWPGHRDVFVAKFHIGTCLLDQQKYAEAEPYLLEAYDRLVARRDEWPDDLPAPPRGAAGEKLVELYEAWGKPEQAAEWRLKLETR